MIEVISGVVAAVIIIFLTQWLSKYFSAKLMAATILVAIAFIYTGFVLKNNSADLIILEVGFSLVLYFLALIGYTKNNQLLGYGIILHGVWDILHHNGLLINTDIPSYWPSFCFIIDILDGVYFVYLFRNPAKVASPQSVQNLQ